MLVLGLFVTMDNLEALIELYIISFPFLSLRRRFPEVKDLKIQQNHFIVELI